MKLFLKTLSILSIAFLSPIFAQNDFEIEGYGELIYQNYDYGPNQNRPDGSEKINRALVDLPRFVLEMKYKFSDEWQFKTEIEYEHGGTGTALELEYEEFGEYEQEVEKGGEIVLEQLHLTRSFSDVLNLKIGHFILPVGLLNRHHKPYSFFTTRLPEAETQIIPVTWHETGIAVFGKYSDLDYEVQIVNGLDASGFSSEHWIKEGHQTHFEGANATDLAFVGHAGWTFSKGVYTGGSIYFGNSTGNRNKPQDLANIDGYVTIFDAHTLIEKNNIILRGQYLYGTLQNANLISARNASISRFIQTPRTPVAKAALAYSVSFGYNISSIFGYDETQIMPFVHYDFYDSMHKTDAGVFSNPRFQRSVLTFGINYFPIQNIVIKADYSMRKLSKDIYNDENTFGLAIGFSGDFFKN